MKDKSVNAGVSAQNGFALQRNTALYILLNNYHSKFKDEKYFVCLEHHDDFLFCFLNDNNNAKIIDSYQSKKKSTDRWVINSELINVIFKLLGTGNNLNNDSIIKAKDYKHNLHFSSNSTIFLEEKKKVKDVIKKNISINETNDFIAFKDLEKEIQDTILKHLNGGDINIPLPNELANEVKNLHFIYIDFAKTDKEQYNQLKGKIEETFGKSIVDYKAAIDALILLFGNIEKIYNQGNIPKLLDETKRVSSIKINDTLKILTTKAKAFDYWRTETRAISDILNIKPFERDNFELCFEISFDLFKNVKQAAHKKILNFVGANYQNCQKNHEEENVLELFQKFKSEKTSNFSDLDLKAIIYAAYFESILKTKS